MTLNRYGLETFDFDSLVSRRILNGETLIDIREDLVTTVVIDLIRYHQWAMAADLVLFAERIWQAIDTQKEVTEKVCRLTRATGMPI